MSKWYKASELERLKTLTPRDGVTGLPDNHVITVSERVISIDNTELIQNNIATDTFTLVLDAEWDGITPIAIFSNAVGNYSVMYEGSATKIPAKVMERTGDVEVSVYGVNEAGDVRVVTQRPESMGMTVIESGKFDGQVSSDDVSLLGKILAAVEKAEQSVETANQSAENANTAAQSATDAATKATQAASTANAAANTANTAASNADSSANAADTAAERAENAYDALTPIIAEIGVNGNQPRATTNPNHVATASDAYAAKPLEICIKGATRQNLWVNPSRTVNGITTTSNEDGTITLSGTSNSSTSTIQVRSYALKPSTQYTFSVDKEISGGNTGFILVQYGESGQNIGKNIVIGKDGFTSNTFTTQSDMSYVYMQVYCNRQDTTVSGTYRVMLNEGSTAQLWCPPGLNSVDELSVVCAGKNLINTNGASVVSSGPYGIDLPNTVLQPGTYRITRPASVEGIVSIYPAYDTSYVVSPVGTPGSTFTVNSPVDGIAIRSADANVVTMDNVGLFQLELGSTATDYEPPQVTTTPIDHDGHSLCSLPDGTCDELTIDATGAVMLTKRVGAATYDGSPDEAWDYSTNPNRLGFGAGAPGSANIVGSGNALCDTLPVRQVVSTPAIMPYTTGHVDLRNDAAITDVESGRSWLASNPTTLLYPLATPQTIPLTSVTLPTLPSPNITVYHDSDVPSDITVEYVQDINIVLDSLNAKIAALNIAQSISS